jgi:hypothetical protein
MGKDEIEKIEYKEYYGSASQYCGGKTSYTEGRKIELECNGMTISRLYQRIKEAIASGISYAGGTNVIDLKRFTCNLL